MGIHRDQERMNENAARQEQSSTIDEQAINVGTTPERLKKQKAHEEKPSGAQSASQQTGDASEFLHSQDIQDGYTTSEGDDYGQPHHDEQVQEEYDPSHSGVRRAHNKPGTRTNAPGREGATGWSEHLQMGKATDTPVRKNPAD